MAGKIHRQKKSSEFVTLDTHCLRNKSLKWDAKGLHSYLMQLPDDWQINIADLEKRGADGRDATTSPMKALIQCGYVVREQTFDSKGRFEGFDYHIFERPEHGLSLLTNGYSENGKTENGKTENGLSVNGKTATSKVLSYSKKSNSKNEGRGNEAENTPSPPKDFDEMIKRVNAEVSTIEAEKEKISPVPAAPSFSGSDISDEADELKNGVVRRDGPNYEAKNKKGSPVSANPLTIHSGFNEVFDAIYEKDENGEYKIRHDVEPSLPVEFDIEIHEPVKRERVVLPPPKDEPTTPLYQPTNPDAAKALISRMKITPKADNEMDARKLIVEWCEAHGEQVKWAYESAKRKHTPEDLAARIIDFSGHFATTDQSGKQLSFFNDPAFMFKNGLTKWLQRQNQFDRDKATKDAQPKNGFAQPVNQSAENRTGMYRKITDL